MISKTELKYIKSLKNKKCRTSERLFLVEGEKNILELLDSDFEIRYLLGTEGFLKKNSENIHRHHFEQVSRSMLSSVSSLQTNDQALAVVVQKEFEYNEKNPPRVLLALDGINDPGNLGTIIRTVDWFGVNHIICSEDTVDFYNPKVISATKGSFTRVRPIYLNLENFMRSFEGVKTGATMSGVSLNDWKITNKPQLLVFGSESHGLRPSIRKLLDECVYISGSGYTESLNVGIAFGIFCWEVLRSS